MNKKELKQFQDLNREIERLYKRIARLEAGCVESDIVTGSNSSFPFQQIAFHIEGIFDNSSRIKKLRKILGTRAAKANDLRLEIEEWIANIPDSRTRQVFEMRYIENRSWVYISRKFGSCNESYARKLHDRFLENI